MSGLHFMGLFLDSCDLMLSCNPIYELQYTILYCIKWSMTILNFDINNSYTETLLSRLPSKLSLCNHCDFFCVHTVLSWKWPEMLVKNNDPVLLCLFKKCFVWLFFPASVCSFYHVINAWINSFFILFLFV